MKLIVAGGMLLYPALDVPPDSFGTRENQQRSLLVNKETLQPQNATIMLAYFTRVGEEEKFSGVGPSNVVQLGTAPFA
jgi:hypothetical protein